MSKLNNKGVALFMVLGTMLIVIVLAGIILSIISSQSRLTHHQVSRIQAYYTAQAGMVYAFERLRTGTWRAGVDCAAPTGCSLQDDAFPPAIENKTINITLIPFGQPGCETSPGNTDCVKIKTTYTYTQ